MDRVEKKRERGGGGVYAEEQEEGERVEFSNIWNQSVCERRGREQGGWMGEDRKKRKKEEKKEQNEMKIRADRDIHTHTGGGGMWGIRRPKPRKGREI